MTPYNNKWNEEPDESGRHPNAKHLILVEFESHHGSVIVTSPAAHGNALLSREEVLSWFPPRVTALERIYRPTPMERRRGAKEETTVVYDVEEFSEYVVDALGYGWVTDEYLSIFDGK